MQIIPKKTLTVEPHWQKELANSFTSIKSLAEYLQLPLNSDLSIQPHPAQPDEAARRLFAMRVPRPFADLMESGNWNDPLLKQVLPSKAEFVDVDGFVSDPLQEQGNQQAGLIHKYNSRVLLVLKGGCAVNCRYCFRRHFPYKENHLDQQALNNALDYIRQDKALNEVILSGGDPLMANNKSLQNVINTIRAIPHIKRLRIHTRLPVVIPNRIDDEFMSLMQTLSTCADLQLVMVLHINHANEVSSQLATKCKLLKTVGVTVLNQSVLLKGVNDSADALCNLSEKLFAADILPYYLFMFDAVKGAAHFDLNKQTAVSLMTEMIKRLPGFLVPKLVKEIPGQPGKTPIDLGLVPQT